MIIGHFPGGSSAPDLSKYLSYTGSMAFSGKQAYFLTSGTLTVKKTVEVDIFLVGGGGGGQSAGCYNSDGVSKDRMGGGGGGGYTATQSGVTLPAGAYTVTIGAGGAGLAQYETQYAAGDGGSTSFAGGEIEYTVNGGGGAPMVPSSVTYDEEPVNGGDGGSGGGAGGAGGGRDGEDGLPSYLIYKYMHNDTLRSYAKSSSGGSGQGTTTRAFGEAWGALYASGGNGGTRKTTNAARQAGLSGAANTGDGGSGADGTQENLTSTNKAGGDGGSGVVIMRLAQ